MATYWIDPYIDTPIGGIHGTTDTTTRSGSYSAPWGMDDIFAGNAQTAINGTTLASGDEVRFKGLSLSSYYYNIGTTGNKIPINGATTNGLGFDGSTYQSNVNTMKNVINNAGEKTCPIIIHDPDLNGTFKWVLNNTAETFFNTAASYDNYIPFNMNQQSSLSGYIRALIGIGTSKGMEIAFIDPDYVYTHSSGYYWLCMQVPTGVTFTDGWTSSTVRDGVTLLIVKDSNTSNTPLYFGQYYNNDSYRATFDLQNTHMLWYDKNWYATYKKPYIYMRRIDETTPFKLGGWSMNTVNAWGYWYRNQASWDTGGEDYTIDIGNFCHGRYFFWSETGYTNKHPRIRIRNYFFGQGAYINGARYNYYFGNMFQNGYYTGSSMFYETGTSGLNTYTLLDSAHMYVYNSNIKGFGMETSSLTVGNNVTFASDQPAKYPGSGTTPLYVSTKANTQNPYFSDLTSGNYFNLAPQNWYDAYYPKSQYNNNNLTNYGYGLWFNQLGVLQCDSSYENINSRLQIHKYAYINNSYFNNENYTFLKNTYDNKPIMIWPETSTTANNVVPCLLSYNDSSDMIVRCTNFSSAINRWYSKSFIFDTPELTGTDTLNFSINISKTATLSTNPQVYLWNYRNNNYGNRITATLNQSGNLLTYSTAITDYDSDINFIGCFINLNNYSGANVSDYWRIQPPTITAT